MRIGAALETVVAETNRAILRAGSPQELFEQTCRIAVERGGYRMAWIGTVDPVSGWLHPAAWAGHVDGYLDDIKVSTLDVPEGRGPMGTAVQERRDVVIDDTATDPAFEPWRAAASARGYRSVVAFPLRDNGDIVAVLGVYADHPAAFDDRDLSVLHGLAEDVSFGLKLHVLADAKRAAESRFQDLFDHAVEGVFRTRLDGRIATANPAAAAILGYDSPQDLVTSITNVRDQLYVDPTQRDAFLAELREHGAVTAYEIQQRRKDGTPVWLAVTARILTAERDGMDGAEGMIVDITARRTAQDEQARRDRTLAAVAGTAELLLGGERWDDRLDELLETLGRGTGTSRVALFRVWTDEHGTLFGGQPRTWAVDPALRLDDADLLQAIPFEASGFARWGEVLASGEPLVGPVESFPAEERPLLDAFGVRSVVIVPVLVDGELWAWLGFDDCDEPLERGEAEIDTLVAAARMLGAAVERQRDHDLLIETDERLTRIVESAPTGIVFVDAGGRVTFANRAAEEALGLERSDVADRTYDDPRWRITDLGGGPFPEAELPVARVLTTGQPVDDVRHAVERPDGTRVALSINAAPLRGPEGELVGVAATFTDITERLHAQQELERYAEELQRSNEELQQFAYVASHDLQEPLRMITSFLGLLQRRYGDGQLGDDADEFIHFAVDGAQRLQTMVDDLLTYSRVQTRGQEPAPVEAQAALDAALANLRTLIDEAGATIEVEDLPVVLADVSQLTVLFQNLLSNAIKFRGDEPPRIHVDATPRGGAWDVTVTDNGIGIAPEHHERVFEIFQRLHTRDEYAGTGIGLAVCRRIVERHGGHIWVESEPGAGTTFHLTLPGAARP